MGFLICIEGGDGSGKATQTKLLTERLQKDGKNVKAISFPDYDSPSSTLVKMYLAGDFGDKPEDVNPYVASTFYADDRFASYRMKWRSFYEEGGLVVADRYTTSNMVHQMVKYEDEKERLTFLEWLEDLEYRHFGLPEPDMVILLDVSLQRTMDLMKERVAKTGGCTGDIHENDKSYLKRCHDAYRMLEDRYAWHRISCDVDGEMRSVESIHEEIYQAVLEKLNQ